MQTHSTGAPESMSEQPATLTGELYLTTPTRPIPQDNPNFAAVRELVNKVGSDIIRQRFFDGRYKPLGVKFWSAKACKERRISIDSAERRINELADERYYDTPLWVRLLSPSLDMDPVIQRQRDQSAYLPNPDHPNWKEFAYQIGLAMRGGQTEL